MDFLLFETPVSYRPIYLNHDELFAVVDHEDYDWAMQWTWSAKPDKHGRKMYAYRTGWDAGRKFSIFLHKVICLRRHGPPPTPRHVVVDHCDSVSLNCRGSNLRWATRSENRLNINGWYARQLRLNLENANGHA